MSKSEQNSSIFSGNIDSTKKMDDIIIIIRSRLLLLKSGLRINTANYYKYERRPSNYHCKEARITGKSRTIKIKHILKSTYIGIWKEEYEMK